MFWGLDWERLVVGILAKLFLDFTLEVVVVFQFTSFVLCSGKRYLLDSIAQ